MWGTNFKELFLWNSTAFEKMLTNFSNVTNTLKQLNGQKHYIDI